MQKNEYDIQFLVKEIYLHKKLWKLIIIKLFVKDKKIYYDKL